MTDLKLRLTRPVISERALLRLLQALCFVATPVILIAGISKSATMATTPEEVLIGVLASGGVSIGLVTLGLIAPMAVRGDKT